MVEWWRVESGLLLITYHSSPITHYHPSRPSRQAAHRPSVIVRPTPTVIKLNPLLVALAALYAGAGLAVTFAPAEVLDALGGETGDISVWAAQIAGAGFLALAMLNWVQRYAVVAGVLGRPLLLTNFLFAMAGAGASLSAWRDAHCTAALVATVLFGAVVVAFAIRLLRPSPAA